MKSMIIACAALAGAALAAGHPQKASAGGCAAGPYRAGCAGPRGAAVAGPHGGAVAGRGGGYAYRGYHGGGYGYRGYRGGAYRGYTYRGYSGPHGAAVVRRPYW